MFVTSLLLLRGCAAPIQQRNYMRSIFGRVTLEHRLIVFIDIQRDLPANTPSTGFHQPQMFPQQSFVAYLWIAGYGDELLHYLADRGYHSLYLRLSSSVTGSSIIDTDFGLNHILAAGAYYSQKHGPAVARSHTARAAWIFSRVIFSPVRDAASRRPRTSR